MKEFFVVRMCNKLDGTVAVPVASFDTKAEAQKEFFRLCGQAVDSTHLTDTVILLSKEGVAHDFRSFAHPAPEPEPESEPEIEEPEGE